MPELPEIEVLRRSLEPFVLGDRIERVEVRDARLREPIQTRELARRVSGRRIDRLDRRGKYLLLDLEGGWSLGVHLGMSGRFTLVPEDEPLEPHEHVAFFLASGRKLRLRDPRRFGLVFTYKTAERNDDPHFSHLGVEPLEPGFSGRTLKAAAEGRRGPVKGFLMDGTVVVGAGNIYAAETLFRAGIHPLRSVARISAKRWDRLAELLVEVLSQAVAEGGTTLNDFADGEGRSGYFQVSLSVYDREGEECKRCGKTIRRTVLGNRSTYFCPGCQR
ncbi:MAG: bifunctional DNA-formamidopyrimidine glycosylase/DNA-(apurinic or apyrimidinic site) lyase [Acidobacteriota bacterium]